MDSRPADTSHATEPSTSSPGRRRCANCDAELHGEHCYACGQPTKGLVRHFSSILGDFADTVFNVDGRIFRTLGPLLFKPGFLSLEYFAGRRVRYVSPVRLFVFTCLIAFLATRFSVDPGDDATAGGANAPTGAGWVDIGNAGDFDQLDSIEDIERRRDQAVAELEKAAAEGAGVPGLAIGMRSASQAIRQAAQRRIEQLQAQRAEAATDTAQTELSTPSTPTAPARRNAIRFDDSDWDPKTNPVQISWLPEAGNARLNAWIERARDNSERVNGNPRLLADAFLDFVPQTLFVLLPIFALMLKFAYLFKRRLYMEHLIVALHSHAFLSLAILLLALASMARSALGEGVLHAALGWVEVVLMVWMPLYLLIMQKRVYRQGWIMTLLKYFLLGTAYSVLVSFGVTVTLMVSLVAM